jgi:hypothetical protein
MHLQAHALRNSAHTLKPHINVFGVQLLAKAKPFR